MASAGETLVETGNTEGADASQAPVVETPAEERQPRKPRKPREQVAELTEPPVETTAEVATEASPEQPEWMQRLQSELGFDNLTDPNDAANRAIEYALQQKRDAEELADWRRQNEAFVGYGREAIANRPPEQKPAEQPKPWQPPVSYPDAVSRYVTKNEETGALDWKPDTPSEVRAQTEKFVAWRDGLIDMLTTRPDRFLAEVIVPLIREEGKNVVEPFYEERTKQQQQQEFFGKYAQENAEWLYTRDPVTGKPTQQFSQAGAALDQAIVRHLERGCAPQEALEYAQFDIQRQTGAMPWVREQDPAEARKQRNREHNKKPLNGAGSVAKRDGSFTDTGTRPQNGNVSAGKTLIDLARREGLDVSKIANA